MSDIDELMQLRPLVSDLRHANEQLRRDKSRVDAELIAERAMNDALRKTIVALRTSHRSEATPAPGSVSSPETSAITRCHREHG